MNRFCFWSLLLGFCIQTSLSGATLRQGKAVFEISKDLGMKLTPKALENIEVKTAKYKGPPTQILPKTSLVYFQDQVGVYRLRDGWFKLVGVQILSQIEGDASIQCRDCASGDEVVVEGAALMRVSEMNAFESAE